MIKNVEQLLQDFNKAAKLSGFNLTEEPIRHELLSAPHKPPTLPKNNYVVYVFSLQAPRNIILKVGKVGPNSNARFQSHHYAVGRAKSSLANSLITKPEILEKYQTMISGEIDDWIKSNTDRNHFFISKSELKAGYLTSLLEIFLQCRLQPLFEG